MAYYRRLGLAAIILSSLLVLAGCGSALEDELAGATEEVIVPTEVPATPTALAATAAVEYLSTITGDPPLKLATGLAVDRDGNIYVVETSTSGVKKFDWQGQLVKQWGSRGKGDGQFLFLGGGGIAIDPQHPEVRRQWPVPGEMGQPRDEGWGIQRPDRHLGRSTGQCLRSRRRKPCYPEIRSERQVPGEMGQPRR